MFTTMCEERDAFIKSIGGQKNLKTLAFSYISSIHNLSNRAVFENENFSTQEEYIPGIVYSVHENEKGNLIIRLIIENRIRQLAIHPDVEYFLREIKEYISKCDFGWCKKELDNWAFMNRKILMFKAIDNTMTHFYIIRNDDIIYITECIDTINELCYK